MRNLRIGQTVQTDDIARLLEGEYGSFLAVQGGQVFAVVSTPGHSITSLIPIGARIPTLNVGPNAEQWQITPISESTDVLGAGRAQEQRSQMARGSA